MVYTMLDRKKGKNWCQKGELSEWKDKNAINQWMGHEHMKWNVFYLSWFMCVSSSRIFQKKKMDWKRDGVILRFNKKKYNCNNFNTKLFNNFK